MNKARYPKKFKQSESKPRPVRIFVVVVVVTSKNYLTFRISYLYSIDMTNNEIDSFLIKQNTC